jgi:hypothetical protein
MLTTLTGCVTSGTSSKKVSSLTPVPGEIVRCFNQLVPAPVAGPKTKAEVVQLIVDLKKSEKAKSDCGKRLIKFYERQM